MLTSGSAEPRRQTVKEIRRKAGQIATAYNKGALQYLPRGKRQLSRLSDEHASSNHSCRDLQGRQCAMCGRLLVGKSKLHVAALVGAAMCSAC